MSDEVQFFVGDVVVGRITEVGQKRWKVECGARLDSQLQLSSVNLPGGELRRKSLEDEKMMRDYLQEGDLVSAEVQNVHQDGVLSLHTRSLKYGKLPQGLLVRVSPSLVQRQKTHFHNLLGASIIFGMNGFIYIAPKVAQDEIDTGGFISNFEPVSSEHREVVARLRNCILVLAQAQLLLNATRLHQCYELSMSYTIKDLLHPDVVKSLADSIRISN